MITGSCKLKVRAQVEIHTNFFSYGLFSVLLGLIEFSDIVIFCVVGQIVVANKTLSVLICLYYPLVCFMKEQQ